MSQSLKKELQENGVNSLGSRTMHNSSQKIKENQTLQTNNNSLYLYYGNMLRLFAKQEKEGANYTSIKQGESENLKSGSALIYKKLNIQSSESIMQPNYQNMAKTSTDFVAYKLKTHKNRPFFKERNKIFQDIELTSNQKESQTLEFNNNNHLKAQIIANKMITQEQDEQQRLEKQRVYQQFLNELINQGSNNQEMKFNKFNQLKSSEIYEISLHNNLPPPVQSIQRHNFSQSCVFPPSPNTLPLKKINGNFNEIVEETFEGKNKVLGTQKHASLSQLKSLDNQSMLSRTRTFSMIDMQLGIAKKQSINSQATINSLKRKSSQAFEIMLPSEMKDIQKIIKNQNFLVYSQLLSNSYVFKNLFRENTMKIQENGGEQEDSQLEERSQSFQSGQSGNTMQKIDKGLEPSQKLQILNTWLKKMSKKCVKKYENFSQVILKNLYLLSCYSFITFTNIFCMELPEKNEFMKKYLQLILRIFELQEVAIEEKVEQKLQMRRNKEKTYYEEERKQYKELKKKFHELEKENLGLQQQNEELQMKTDILHSECQLAKKIEEKLTNTFSSDMKSLNEQQKQLLTELVELQKQEEENRNKKLDLLNQKQKNHSQKLNQYRKIRKSILYNVSESEEEDSSSGESKKKQISMNYSKTMSKQMVQQKLQGIFKIKTDIKKLKSKTLNSILDQDQAKDLYLITMKKEQNKIKEEEAAQEQLKRASFTTNNSIFGKKREGQGGLALKLFKVNSNATNKDKNLQSKTMTNKGSSAQQFGSFSQALNARRDSQQNRDNIQLHLIPIDQEKKESVLNVMNIVVSELENKKQEDEVLENEEAKSPRKLFEKASEALYKLEFYMVKNEDGAYNFKSESYQDLFSKGLTDLGQKFQNLMQKIEEANQQKQNKKNLKLKKIEKIQIQRQDEYKKQSSLSPLRVQIDKKKTLEKNTQSQKHLSLNSAATIPLSPLKGRGLLPLDLARKNEFSATGKIHFMVRFIQEFNENYRNNKFDKISLLSIKKINSQLNKFYSLKANNAKNQINIRNASLAEYMYDSIDGMDTIRGPNLQKILVTILKYKDKFPKLETFARFVGITQPSYTNDDLNFMYTLYIYFANQNVIYQKKEFNFEVQFVNCKIAFENLTNFFDGKLTEDLIVEFRREFYQLVASTYGIKGEFQFFEQTIDKRDLSPYQIDIDQLYCVCINTYRKMKSILLNAMIEKNFITLKNEVKKEEEEELSVIQAMNILQENFYNFEEFIEIIGKLDDEGQISQEELSFYFEKKKLFKGEEKKISLEKIVAFIFESQLNEL